MQRKKHGHAAIMVSCGHIATCIRITTYMRNARVRVWRERREATQHFRDGNKSLVAGSEYIKAHMVKIECKPTINQRWGLAGFSFRSDSPDTDRHLRGTKAPAAAQNGEKQRSNTLLFFGRLVAVPLRPVAVTSKWQWSLPSFSGGEDRVMRASKRAW
jgi:hypothetical protein